MRVAQVQNGQRFVVNGNIYIFSLHNSSHSGKVAVWNITKQQEEYLDATTICELEEDMPEILHFKTVIDLDKPNKNEDTFNDIKPPKKSRWKFWD